MIPPMPGKAFLVKSLKLWERRVAYRRQRVLSYRRRKSAELRRDRKVSRGTKWRLALWERRYAYAGRVVRRRQNQLKDLRVKKGRPATPGVSGPRRAAILRAGAQLGLVERPAGSNRGPGITEMQQRLGAWLVGLAWCGVYLADALRAAGVKVTYRMASVALVEDDARAGRNGLRSWRSNKRTAIAGDVAIMFGRGVHMELIVSVHSWGCVTRGGNTSPEGGSGSQSNGGGSYQRNRPWASIYGVAVPAYPDS